MPQLSVLWSIALKKINETVNEISICDSKIKYQIRCDIYTCLIVENENYIYMRKSFLWYIW